MKKILLNSFTLIFFLCSVVASNAQTNGKVKPDEIMKAMRDEAARTLSKLEVDKLQKPYYVEYTLTLRHNNDVKATLGTLLESNGTVTAVLTVGVRVGDYKFDNTNFFDVGLGFFGSSDDEERFKSRVIPYELDYSTLRRELWLATDAAYKRSAEIYSKKEATIKNRNRLDTTIDFTNLSPVFYADTFAAPPFNKANVEKLCRELSEIFKKYPNVYASSIGVEYIPQTVFYVNSEGREYIKTVLYAGFEAVAASQADDGMHVANMYSAYAKSPDGFPDADSLSKAVTILANDIVSIRDSKHLEEPYTGPVLFEGQAAAEIFAQNFAPYLVSQRQQLTEQGTQDNERYTAFQNKIGGRVLPEFLSVDAEPSLKDFGRTYLAGSFTIDDEGVQAQDVNLVKNGYLKSLLSSRIPTRRIHQSNGHYRGGAAMLSVLKVSADEEHKKTPQELKDKLIQLCKDRELPYGILIKKVMNQNIMYTTLYNLTDGDYDIPQGMTETPLVEVYKVYQDGREEMIRSCRAKGITAQSFKDILLVGDHEYAMNYLAPAVMSPFMTGGSQYLISSVIVPDILIEDAEIHSTDNDFPKPAILTSPLLINNK
jgi:hypothetical protein